MSIEKKILKLIETHTINKNKNNQYVDFALSASEIEDFKKIFQKDFSGYSHCIDKSGIIHVLKRHKNINCSDFLLIPFIIKNYDIIGLGKEPNTIVYKKLIGDEFFYIEEIRQGRKKLAIKTFYKRKNRQSKN